ncbi:cell division protein ZapE [Enteractinococcus fodinae]|uniref:Cell division protein ZapE n=1 Tax=Enteractinococcus fodinae TaxID=684663 RepID=A0ABU2AZ40_9MICC|nr:cell division protein ZapE [Enteractinococcus fodinae]MDR7346619.1 cell division protein ZapE [Enteractinococcus fodinae]
MEIAQTLPSQTVASALLEIESLTGTTLDASQRRLATAVIELLHRSPQGSHAPADVPTGYFVYGPPGRGKTWLMSQLFERASYPAETKRHVHFHDFFRNLQQQLGPGTSMRKAIEATLTELLAGTELFFFDELHVHDPGSAALLNNLLAEIAERGIPTLITSNYEPEGLLPDVMFHHVIEPSITILREQFVVEELDGGTDYRSLAAPRSGGFASGHWLTLGPGQATQDALLSVGEIAPGSDEVVTVLEGHRALQASAVRGSQIWFDFANLLGTRSVTHDYLELAEQFDAWRLTDVPRLSRMDPASRQRLVTLIDVLVERDRPLIVCAEVSREELVDIADPPPDLFRTQSRLQLLQ